MGDFQRSRSKVWWSNYTEADEEAERRPLGPESSINRGSSSSPSSSHKSQDSGFSDSENSPPSSVGSKTNTPPNSLTTLHESTSTVPKKKSTSECSADCSSASINQLHLLVVNECGDFSLKSKSVNGSQLESTVDVSKNYNKNSSKTNGNVDTSILSGTLNYGNVSSSSKTENSRRTNVLNVSNNNISADTSIHQNLTSGLILPPIEYLDLRPIQHPHCLDLTDPPGLPTYTSTPKASSSSSTVKKLINRRLNIPSRSSATNGKKHARPVNLLKNFNSTPDYNKDQGPVHHWLGEIGRSYEPECMTTLQSKSLAIDLSRQIDKMSAETTSTVKELQEKTRLISTEFAKLVQQIEFGIMNHIGPLVQSLVGNIIEFLYDYGNKEKTEDNRDLIQVCDKLRRSAFENPIDKEEVSLNITTLGHSFTHVVDIVLTKHIKALVTVLEEPSSEMALRSALTSLTTLGLDGTHLSSLVTNCGGVRALLVICFESKASSVRTAALRTLATVCCVSETIRQLEQAGGIEILSEILSDVERPESEMSEAAAVLAQITAPWVEDNHSIQGLAAHLPTLIQSLTRLVSATRINETLLLSAAALANLTFMEPQSVWPLLEYSTAGELLRAIRKQGSKVSVFLQEQAATLLANMAAVPESRSHLAEQNAVVALLCFLQIRHSPLQRAPEIAAAERVQQKSAIGLSRLCSDPVVAQQVVALQGVSRLVRLCKEERERNHSDGVLVACLAALRKIAANCGTKVIEDLDAMELVEPRLLDSFLIYSSRQESYV